MKLLGDSMLDPYVPSADRPFDANRAHRILTRLGFGASSTRVDAAVAAGHEATLDAALHPSDDEGDAVRRDLLRAPELARYQGWWIAQALASEHPLRERWALHWHDHFACSVHKPIALSLMLRQNEVFRWLGGGGFGALLHAMLDDPAMLIWLDADQNVVGRPNENFAREILELFALGRGEYDQGDVRELARALTGLRVDVDRVRVAEAAHDGGRKSLFGRTGLESAAEAIDAVLVHPACARWVSSSVWRGLVGADADERTADELARTFRDDGLHVGRLIERIARSRAFLEPAELPTRIAGPVELVLTMVRRLEVDVDPVMLAGLADRMGQSLFAPPSVDGWPTGRGWLGSTWCLRRLELAGALLLQTKEGRVADEAAAADPSPWVARTFCSTESSRAAVARAGAELGRRGITGLDATALLLALPETHQI